VTEPAELLRRIVDSAPLPPADPLARANWYSERINRQIRDALLTPSSRLDKAAVSVRLQELTAGMMVATYEYLRSQGQQVPDELTDFNFQLKIAADNAARTPYQ
jgi:hypothetical protein